MKNWKKIIVTVLTALLWVWTCVLTPVVVIGVTCAVSESNISQACLFVLGAAFCWASAIYATVTIMPNQNSSKTRLDRLKVKLDEGAMIPMRAHSTDAGYDLFAIKGCGIPAGGSATFDTGVHIGIPAGYVGFLKSKSGLNVKFGMTSEGVIDAGYTGSIVVKLYNHSEESYTVADGDKITQLVVLPIATPELNLVDSLEETDRGNNGFGSSGR